MQGRLFVISAPSGTGKTSIIRKFFLHHPEVIYSVSATTRPMREMEIDGKDYFFLSEEVFRQKIANNEFLEWEKLYDYYYGTLKSFVADTISASKHIIIEVDVKGALSIKKIFPEASLIFIEPPSLEELEKRLVNRKTENHSDLQKRLERAKMEMEQKSLFDVSILNEDVERAAIELTEYIISKINKE